MRTRIALAVSLLASSTLAAIGCGGSSPTLQSVSVFPSSVTLSVGKTTALSAKASYSDGTQSTAASAQWSSSAPSVATVSDSGVVTAVAAGTATVTATQGGKSGACAVTVSPPALTGISASPASVTLALGGTQAVAISGTYSDGSKAAIASGVQFSSSNAAIATVDNTGLVKGVAAGSAQITAAVSGMSTTVNVTVSAAALTSLAVAPQTVSLGVGDAAKLTATGTFDDASHKDMTASATWTSSDATIATVDNQGNVTAVAVGGATITATLQGKSGQASVAVGANPKVFVDDYGPSESFQGFGGAADDVARDATTLREGRASLKAVVSTTAYMGGAITTTVPRDLSSYNAVTFWAKASKAVSFDKVGLGNNNADAPWAAEVHDLALTTDFTKFIVPIPLPSKATSFDGLFHFATAAGDYTVWFNDIQYENLGSTVLGTPTAAIATESVSKVVGATATIAGETATFPINGTPVAMALVSPRYFTFTSSDPTIASVDLSGTVTAVKLGTATITAKLGDVSAAGTLTIKVAPASVPSSAPAAPTAPGSDVIALYSATYAGSLHPVDGWRADWSSNSAYSQYSIDSYPVLEYANLDFFGIEFKGTNSINATSMAAFHLDVFTPDATEVHVKLVDFGADNAYGGGDDSEAEVPFNATTTPALAQGQWVSLDIAFSAFTAVNASFNRAHLSQLVISGSTGSTLYLDNVYFHK